jgi:hypothetical protein
MRNRKETEQGHVPTNTSSESAVQNLPLQDVRYCTRG